MREHTVALHGFACRTLIALAISGAQLVGAQEVTLRGVVMDSSHAPVPMVAVAVVAVHQVTRTDSLGRFTLTKLPAGEVQISIRRIGFEPATLKRILPASGIDSMRVMLVELPQALDAMSVAERHLRLGVEEFYYRRAQGIAGVFFTKDEIRAQRASTPSDLMRTTAGVRFVRVPSGKGIRFASAGGMRRGDCQPVVWIDGQAAPGMELDDIPLNDIEGIELYRGVSTTPGQFWRSGASQCGAIVIWSRVPGTP
jgi:Carboxypeptidase regulatory-like domain/TonB-dependent Receptor Plug Domain